MTHAAIVRHTEAAAEQVSQALTLLRDAVGRAAGQFLSIVAMSVLTASLEGFALVLLPSVLGGGLREDSRLALLPKGHLGLAGLLALYLVLVGVAAGLLYTTTVASSRLSLAFGERLRLRLHAAVLQAASGSPALSRPSDLIHALTTQAAQCARATQIIIGLATRLLYLPSLLAAAILLSPRLALAALILAAAAAVPALSLARRAYAIAKAMARVATRLHGEIADDLAGLKLLKVLQAEPLRKEALRERLVEIRDVSLRQTRATALVQSWQRLAAAMTAVAGAFYGLRVLHLEAAAILALTIALARLASNVSQVADQWRQLGRLLPVYAQLSASELQCRMAAEPHSSPTAPRLRQSLRLCSVAFAYPGVQKPTFTHLDLSIPALSLTALTGPTGAGKSTLADLLMGLTVPTAGEILIDGIRLDGAARMAWRAHVAYVAQEPFLFHDTIRANLRLARQDASETDLQDTLDAAAATFALRLPQGLDTIVGERGNRLSGGERQRLMLAQALLRRPDLLILDEATNALDPASELEVIARLNKLKQRMTILVIAHRSAMLELADHVIHLEHGGIASIDRRPSPPMPVSAIP